MFQNDDFIEKLHQPQLLSGDTLNLPRGQGREDVKVTPKRIQIERIPDKKIAVATKISMDRSKNMRDFKHIV